MRTKVCARCDKRKKVEQFGRRNKSKDKRHPYCKACRREYDREHHKNNKAQYAARNRKARQRLAAFVRSLKEGVPCVDCANTYPSCVMEFDHVRGSKVCDVSAMSNRGMPKKAILIEIAKCDLVCANCHRIRTCLRTHDHSPVRP